MPIEPEIYELLYVSTIATGIDLSEVGKIARIARVTNARRNVTGLLVFDGESFAQQLEGPSERVRELFERIRSDPRHTNIRVLHQGTCAKRTYRRFAMGYADLDELDSLQYLGLKGGEEALRSFAELVPKIDLEPC